jgi:hypothetical protein
VRFVLNRAGVRSEILQSSEIAAVIAGAAENAAPAGTSVELSTGRTRQQVRIVGEMDSEGSAGTLTQALGAVRV